MRGLCGMKRVSILIIASLFALTFLSVSPVNANTEQLQWSFEEGDYIDYRFISDGLVLDEIISFRIDSPLPEWCETPPDTYTLGALDNWMEIPLVPVTAFIPFGGSITEVDGFPNVFAYGGLASGYWCRFAVPEGVSKEDYEGLVERWTDGPHGSIETHILQPSPLRKYLYWGFEYGFELLDTIYNVTVWYFQRESRLANITIVGHDSTTEAQTHSLMMVSDWGPPIVSSPDDINFTIGTTGEEISWKPHDYLLDSYEILRNGTLTQSGPLVEDNPHVIISLDGLEVGVWNFTIVVTDFLMNSVSDTVFVTVKSGFAIGSEVLLIAAGVGAVAIIGIVIIMRRR